MGHFSVANWCICKIEVHFNQIDQSNLSHNLKQSYYITINEQNTTYCVIFVTTINLMAIKLTAIKIAIYEVLRPKERNGDTYAAKKQSQTSACFTVMTGRRRIGKTALLLESVKDTRFVYIFVARKSEVLLCAQYQPVIRKHLAFVSMEKSESSHSSLNCWCNIPKRKISH